eukprot:symbB.v1.2.035459.t1/scaffold4765.1/size35197/2
MLAAGLPRCLVLVLFLLAYMSNVVRRDGIDCAACAQPQQGLMFDVGDGSYQEADEIAALFQSPIDLWDDARMQPPRKRQKRDDPEPVTGDGQDAQMSDAERALMTAPTLELGDTAPDDPEDGLQRGASKALSPAEGSAAMLDLKRGGTFDAALDVMSVQKGVAPVAAHAAAASQARTSGAIGLGDPCRKKSPRLPADALPVLSEEEKQQYKTYWGQFKPTPTITPTPHTMFFGPGFRQTAAATSSTTEVSPTPIPGFGVQPIDGHSSQDRIQTLNPGTMPAAPNLSEGPRAQRAEQQPQQQLPADRPLPEGQGGQHGQHAVQQPQQQLPADRPLPEGQGGQHLHHANLPREVAAVLPPRVPMSQALGLQAPTQTAGPALMTSRLEPTSEKTPKVVQEATPPEPVDPRVLAANASVAAQLLNTPKKPSVPSIAGSGAPPRDSKKVLEV